MEPKPYIRTVHYYETDQMGVVHHSNYIRWLEEARLDLMEQIGISYSDLEAQGIIIPVVDVSCSYQQPVRYGDTVEILPLLTQFTGVRMAYRYEIRIVNSDHIAATATSTHCFVDQRLVPFSMKKKHPDLHERLSNMVVSE